MSQLDPATMIAASEIISRPGLLLAGAVAVAIGMLASLYVAMAPGAPDQRTVIKVCWDGSLVLRMSDGDFEVVRPGAWRGWRAVGPGVCQ
jgi:hypothetical protein